MNLKRSLKNTLLLVLVFYIISGCNESTGVSKTVLVQLGNASQVDSIGGSYVTTFSPATTNIPLNRYFDLEVTITGVTQQPLAYAVTLEVDAGMTAHHHGMNVKPNIKRLANGTFRVEGMLFHMLGEWFLRFTVRRGLMSDTAKINIKVMP